LFNWRWTTRVLWSGSRECHRAVASPVRLSKDYKTCDPNHLCRRNVAELSATEFLGVIFDLALDTSYPNRKRFSEYSNELRGGSYLFPKFAREHV
jgi:hypothetical protein